MKSWSPCLFPLSNFFGAQNSTDEDTPGERDRVYVRFNGSYNGVPFGDTVSCKHAELGNQELIRGMEIAIQRLRMRVGSVAHITLESVYAFGGEGLQNELPPNARVEFDLTLLGWHSVYNVTEGGEVVITLRGRASQIVTEKEPKTIVCADGTRVRFSLYAFCHNVGVIGAPLAPGDEQRQYSI
jgi:hypothetical protein